MELFELISQFIMAATIFQKMGTGSQSGKLVFKRLYSGDNIIIEDGPNAVTISNTFIQNPIIQNRVVMGTGDNITNSVACDGSAAWSFFCFCKNGYQSFLSGPADIANYSTSLSPVFFEKNYTLQSSTVGKSNSIKTSYNTILISGMNNSHCPSTAEDSLIISGRYNGFLATNCQKFLSILGGLGNSFRNRQNSNTVTVLDVKGTSYYSSIIGGQRNCIISSLNSVILGGDRNKLYGPTATGTNINSNIIGGCLNFISSNQSSECVRDSIIISGNKNWIRQGVNNSSIISSECSTIGINPNYPTLPFSEAFNVRNSTIISGKCNRILTDATEASILDGYYKSNSNNSIINGYRNVIQSTSYNTIVSGEQNIIQLLGESQDVYLKNNSIVSSQFSCIIHSGKNPVPAMSSKFNTIISSKNSKLVSLEPKFGQFLITSIIGGESNCTICSRSCSSFFKYSTFIGGNKNFIQTADDINFSEDLTKWTYSTVLGGSGLSASGLSIGGSNNRTKTTSSTILGGIDNQTSGKIISSCGSCGLNDSIILSGFRFCSGSILGDLPDRTVAVGGFYGISDGNRYSIMISPYKNRLQSTENSLLVGGALNCIVSHTVSQNVCNNFIISGSNNRFSTNCSTNNFCAQDTINSGIIGGSFNRIYKASVNQLQNTVILGATGMSTSVSNTMVVKNMWITATLSTGSPDHFTQSFTYSLDGITGNFLNPSNIRFVNGIIVEVVGQKVDYTKKLQFTVAPGAPGGASPSFTFSVSQVTSPEILVQWGDTRSATFSGSSITRGNSYSSTSNRTITVFGTFSGFTYSLQEAFGYGSLLNISDYGSVSRITVTGSFAFGGSGNFNTSAFTSVNNWQYINFSRNNFSVANVNSILVHLDSLPVGTVTDVLLFSQSTPAVPTGAGSASRAQLLSEGVNVVTDWPY